MDPSVQQHQLWSQEPGQFFVQCYYLDCSVFVRQSKRMPEVAEAWTPLFSSTNFGIKNQVSFIFFRCVGFDCL